jgi:hypothetical protein
VNLFDDPQEGAGVEPTREWGYQDSEECATNIYAWKGLSPPDLALLRLPERLYAVRKGLDLVDDAISRQVCSPLTNPPPSPALNFHLTAAEAHADATASAISQLQRTAAESELAAAESELGEALQSLEAVRIDVSWEVQHNGTAYVDVTSGDIVQLSPRVGVTVQGKHGRTLNSPLNFDVTGAAGDALRNGHFEGTITLEFVDTNGQETNPELFESVRILVDAPSGYHNVVLDYRSRESAAWRSVQCDLVNARFVQGLSCGAGCGADIRVDQPKTSPPASVPRALHSLRIEGYSYTAGCWIGGTGQ